MFHLKIYANNAWSNLFLEVMQNAVPTLYYVSGKPDIAFYTNQSRNAAHCGNSGCACCGLSLTYLPKAGSRALVGR